MGQTLTHGIYLPDEGERNCYAGLASNWSILDGAVGTVAEHTTQIAGKAPLVHTHTKADITDFPAYGNAAGTICEGNDSRLSDARTPVAHTHTKADITDLFNSNFIPSANNSYDLGSSSNQWNNLYAKNYYYNGTAWGLDKSNEWTADQTIASNRFLRVYGYRFQVKNAGMELGTVPSSNQWTGMQFVDKNNTAISEIVQSFQSSGNTLFQINVWPNEANSEKRSVIAYTYSSANNNNALGLTSNLLPTSNNTYDLGISTLKWKTLNGINPGALSLPDVSSGDPIDTTNWGLTGGANVYTPSDNGWVYIRTTGDTNSFIVVRYGGNYGSSPTSSYPIGTISHLSVFVPVMSGVDVRFYVKCTAIEYALFYPCQGNV